MGPQRPPKHLQGSQKCRQGTQETPKVVYGSKAELKDIYIYRNTASDVHFRVTLGGVLAPKGPAGAAKVASEAPKCSQGDCQRRLGLEKACIRGPKDVQEEPRVSIVRISGCKMMSK